MSVIASKNHPLADRDKAWDAAAAGDRIRRWAGGPDKEDMAKQYKRFDEEPPELRGESSLEQRVGAVLSQRNRDNLSKAVELIQDVIQSASKEENSLSGVETRNGRPVEVRALPLTEIELREEDGKGAVLKGQGIPYNKRSQPIGNFIEIIKPGAFTKSLKRGHEIKAFINHDPSMVLATTESKPPLKLSEAKDGVRYELEIPDTSYGEDLQKNVAAKRVKGSSFAFGTVLDRWRQDADGTNIREVLEAELYELGPVTNPAYLETGVQMRSAEAAYKRYLETNLSNEPEPKPKTKNWTPEERMANLIVRAKRGELTESDREAIESTIDTLRSYLPDGGGRAPKPSDSEEDGARARLVDYQRRLEVAELAMM